MAVDRCVCWDVPFEELRRLHEREGLDLDALSRRTGCCTGCGSCEPYVRLMLRTGRTRFPPMSARQLDAALRESTPPDGAR